MKRLVHLSLIAQEVEKLKRFYQEVLGFSLEFETEDKLYCQYSLGETENKFDLEHLSLIQADLPGSTYQGFFLRFEVADLEEVAKQCLQFGGRVVRGPIKQDYGSTEMYLEDPEGNLLQVYKVD